MKMFRIECQLASRFFTNSSHGSLARAAKYRRLTSALYSRRSEISTIAYTLSHGVKLLDGGFKYNCSPGTCLAITQSSGGAELDRLFDVSFVRSPSDSYVNCVSTNPDRTRIDVGLARKQHREYVSVMKGAGVDVIELPPLERYPDSVFMQDPALLGCRRSVVGRFGEERRRGEEEMLIQALTDHKHSVGSVSYVEQPGTLEGGDIVVSERGIFVGESPRTNTEGIRQLAKHLSGLDVKPVKTSLFHLLCGCSYLTDGTMIIAPELVDPEAFPGFGFVTVPKEEAYACDALYVGHGKVIIPSGFPRASKSLREAGYSPLEVDVSEFHKGDGGVTCLASPVYKLF